jgi:hypothetical protein
MILHQRGDYRISKFQVFHFQWWPQSVFLQNFYDEHFWKYHGRSISNAISRAL